MRSVTQILKAAGLVDTTWFTDEAALRGTEAHNTCHAAVLGERDHYDAADPVVVACLEAVAACGIEIAFVEPQLVHGRLGYEGHPDWLGAVVGRPAVVEIKTGARQPWHGVQLAGYALLVLEGADWRAAARLLDRYALYLTPPRWKLVPYRDDRDYVTFLNALTHTKETACPPPPVPLPST